MYRTTLTAAALAALAVPTMAVPAAANPLSGLLDYTGQIRGQMQLVQARAQLAFESCPSARLLTDDIFDELEDLCRDLDRLEEQIARPIPTRHQLRRLERLVHRLDDQACDVDEAIREALQRAQRRGARQQQVAFLPNRLPYGYPGITRHTVGHRGVRVLVSGGRFNLSVGAPTPHRVARPLRVSQGFGGGVPEHLAAALCAESDRLRLMTKQLIAIVCR